MKVTIQVMYLHETEVEAPDGLSEEELVDWLCSKADEQIPESIDELEWTSSTFMNAKTDEEIASIG